MIRQSNTGDIRAAFPATKEKMDLDSKIDELKTELEQTRDELNDILDDIRTHLATLRTTFQDMPTDDKRPTKQRTRRG